MVIKSWHRILQCKFINFSLQSLHLFLNLWLTLKSGLESRQFLSDFLDDFMSNVTRTIQEVYHNLKFLVLEVAGSKSWSPCWQVEHKPLAREISPYNAVFTLSWEKVNCWIHQFWLVSSCLNLHQCATKT